MSGIDDEREGAAGKTAVTRDDFLGGRLKLLQPARGFRAGLDAVLLAAAVPGRGPRPSRVLDVGAGVGTAGLCLASRLDSARVSLLEVSPVLAALARENIAGNGMSDRAAVIEADVSLPTADIAAAGLQVRSFDEVIANPPYLDPARHRLPVDATAAAAFGMAPAQLDVWVRFIDWALVHGGHVTVIHRADTLGEVLAALSRRFGGLCVLPIYPRAGEAANRVIVRGKKGSKAPLALLLEW